MPSDVAGWQHARTAKNNYEEASTTELRTRFAAAVDITPAFAIEEPPQGNRNNNAIVRLSPESIRDTQAKVVNKPVGLEPKKSFHAGRTSGWDAVN